MLNAIFCIKHSSFLNSPGYSEKEIVQNIHIWSSWEIWEAVLYTQDKNTVFWPGAERVNSVACNNKF